MSSSISKRGAGALDRARLGSMALLCALACSSSEGPAGAPSAGEPSATPAAGSPGSGGAGSTPVPAPAAGGSVSEMAGASTGGGFSALGGSPSSTAGAETGGSSAAGATGSSAGGPSAGSSPGPSELSAEGDGDFTLTSYPTSPELAKDATRAGREFRFNLTGSKLFPGTASRAISVYIPAQYQSGTAAPVMVVQDGAGSQYLRVRAALDNLSQAVDPARRIPAFVLIAIASGQRSLEYDTMSDRYARFVNDEVFPQVLANAAVKAEYPKLAFTDNPEGRGSIGCSSGGSAAITMAWFRPDLFRRVIGYSASLVDLQAPGTPEAATYPFGAWEYHSNSELIKNSEIKPVRMVFNDNELDNGAGTGEAGHKDWPLAGQRTAAALKAKGYHYRFLMGKGAKHCSDARVQDTSMPDSLVWVWRGYPLTP